MVREAKPGIYRMSRKEEVAKFKEVINHVTLNKKFFMNVCPVQNK
jgi:hypothetical protein